MSALANSGREQVQHRVRNSITFVVGACEQCVQRGDDGCRYLTISVADQLSVQNMRQPEGELRPSQQHCDQNGIRY